MTDNTTFESRSADETFEIALGIGKTAKGGDVYCLTGTLGAGKTVFAKGFAKGMGVSDLIVSPTFVIHNQYNGKFTFNHFDVYRITHIDQLDDIGFYDCFEIDSVCLIEWADIVKEAIPDNAIWVNISTQDSKPDNRLIEIRNGCLYDSSGC